MIDETDETDETETETKTETDAAYVCPDCIPDEPKNNLPDMEPPVCSWLLLDYIEATPKQIEEKTVDCSRCPVYMLCETGQGGTGWTCPKCNATGVWLDQPAAEGVMPEHVLVMYCAKHKFHKRKDCDQIPQCSLCSGGLMLLEAMNKGTKNHMVICAETKVDPLELQKTLKKGYAKALKDIEEKALKKSEK